MCLKDIHQQLGIICFGIIALAGRSNHTRRGVRTLQNTQHVCAHVCLWTHTHLSQGDPVWHSWRRGGFSGILMGHVKSTYPPRSHTQILIHRWISFINAERPLCNAHHDPFQPILLHLKDDGKTALPQQHGAKRRTHSWALCIMFSSKDQELLLDWTI